MFYTRLGVHSAKKRTNAKSFIILNELDDCGISAGTVMDYRNMDSDKPIAKYYTSVKKHDDKGLTVIDAATLRSMSIVSAPSDKSLIIRKCKEEQL